MSWNSKIIWSEGMFLQPQHLQQHDRYFESLVERRTRPIAPYSWGYANFVIDDAALRLGKVALGSASGIMPDGTPISFPGDDFVPPPLNVPTEIKDALIVLALPLRRTDGLDADIMGADPTGLTRYVTGEREVADNTLSDAPTAQLQLGDLRLRLMLERDASDAYATLGVVRVIERRADNQLILDKAYIPPTLACDGNPVLAGHLGEVLGMLQQRGEELGARLAQPGRGGVAEVADFMLLQTVNRYEPVFKHLSELAALHPSALYAQCLMLAGDLSTFSRESRRPIDYPRYIHDDVHTCFGPVMTDLRHSLSITLLRGAIPIELQERQYGVRVAVVPDLELLRTAQFVLAVNAQLPGDALRARFPTQVTIGPVERIKELVNLHLPGIALRTLPVAPRQIPFHAGFTYFELERSGEMWKQLQKSGGLAMHIAGEFPGLELECWAIRN